MTRFAKVAVVVYLVILCTVIAAGALRFGHLNSPGLPPVAAQKSVMYGQFLRATQAFLAAFVGALSGLCGLHCRSAGLGALGLCAGVVVTAAGYGFLPRFYFPGGDMTAWGLWTANAYVYVLSWAAVTLIGRLLRRDSACGARPR